jgi:uncharacterized protein
MGLEPSAFYPELAPVDAYGAGGFRFAGMSHKGSLLFLPSGIMAWDVASIADTQVPDFAPVLAVLSRGSHFLLGCGLALRRPGLEVVAAFAQADIWLEVMDTGAACRTFNVLLGEDRQVYAGLIAVP